MWYFPFLHNWPLKSFWLLKLKFCIKFQDPNADTEWNDVLRAKGILPPKEEKELTEDDIVALVESTIENKAKGS